MVANRKVSGTAVSMPVGLALGGVVSMGVTVLGSVLAANLVLREVIPEQGVGYCSMIILLLSSILGALTAVNKIKHRRLLICGLSAVIYYASLLAVTALFFGGIYQGMGVTALMVLAGSATTALLGARKEKLRNQSRGKMKHR